MAYYEGQISDIGCCNNGNNNNGWNNGWEWIIALALIGGWGGGFGGGFGGGGRGGYGVGDFTGWQMGRLATTNDVASGFSTSEIMSDLNSIILGQAQQINYTNQGFAGLNTALTSGFSDIQSTLCQGFNGVNSAIANTTSTLGYNMLQGFNGIDKAFCTLGYQNQTGFNALSTQLAQCCCDTRAAIADVKYANEKQTCDILAGQNAQTRAILDYLTGEKISALQAENAGLKAQISNDKQSAYLLNELKPCPKASYIVQPPQQVTFPTNCCGNVAYAGYGYGACGASVQ